MALLIGEVHTAVSRDRRVVRIRGGRLMRKQVFTDRERLDPRECASAVDGCYGEQDEREESEEDEAHDHRQMRAAWRGQSMQHVEPPGWEPEDKERASGRLAGRTKNDVARVARPVQPRAPDGPGCCEP